MFMYCTGFIDIVKGFAQVLYKNIVNNISAFWNQLAFAARKILRMEAKPDWLWVPNYELTRWLDKLPWL